jgi:biopolymer transport protein ExbB
MLKLTTKFLIAAALLCGTFLQGNTLNTIKEGARADLDQALDELSVQRARIREEKVPLSTQRRQLELEVRELRAEAAAVRNRLDTADVRLGQLRNQISSREDELQYVANLLDEYLRGLQSRMHIAEVASYETDIRRILDLAEEVSARFEAAPVLAEAMAIGLQRLKNLSGGHLFEGGAVLQDGQFVQGSFILTGPLAFFANQNTGGMVIRGDSLRPSVEAITNFDIAKSLASLKQGGLGIFPIDATLGNARAISQVQTSLWGHIQKGGVWIVPILGFAFVSLAIALYKALALYGIKSPADSSMHTLLDLIGAGKHEEALRLAKTLPGPGGEMLHLGVRHSKDSIALVEEVCIEKVIEAQPKVLRLLAVIATTAAVAPLLGLLGTVTGMITTFELITIFGTGDARNLSSGISEALVTTEYGLIVAIPSLVIHALLSRKANGILARMEKQAISFVNGLKIQREQKAA